MESVQEIIQHTQKKIEVACHYIQSNKKTTEWKLSADVAKNTHEDTPRSN